jgi:presenilin-like A22 family membrane protease
VRFDALTLFGVVAVSVMVICYALESRSHWFTLGMAACCIAAAVYGFLAGTWPFGVLEAVWASIAIYKWRGRRADHQ